MPTVNNSVLRLNNNIKATLAISNLAVITAVIQALESKGRARE